MRLTKSMSLVAMALLGTVAASAQNFDDYFEDKTLRLDYIVAGDSVAQSIYFEQAYSTPTWAGRKTRLAEKFLNGNGQVTVYEHGTDKVLYVNTFSTLFQEWQLTAEAKHLQKAFESSFIVPFPKQKVDVAITLSDTHQKVTTELRHTVDPTDILIRPLGENGIPYKYIVKSGNTAECIDLAIVAEGYRQDQMDKFYKDAQRAVDAIFEREPFKSLKPQFNVVAVAAPSLDEGPSIPHDGKWTTTLANSHYDTFYSKRYLTTSKIHRIYDALSNVPFEQIIVLINAETYGGGGIYNQVTLSTADHPTFKKVLVHEFGHGYAGLGDEYSTDEYDPMYPSDTEPWEPNLTTLKDFQSKWADMMPKGVKIPTPLAKLPNNKNIKNEKEQKQLNDAVFKIGVFEGAGNQSKGCYRPAQVCRMRINEVDDFCPVCQRAIKRITDFYTGKGEK